MSNDSHPSTGETMYAPGLALFIKHYELQKPSSRAHWYSDSSLMLTTSLPKQLLHVPYVSLESERAAAQTCTALRKRVNHTIAADTSESIHGPFQPPYSLCQNGLAAGSTLSMECGSYTSLRSSCNRAVNRAATSGSSLMRLCISPGSLRMLNRHRGSSSVPHSSVGRVFQQVTTQQAFSVGHAGS